MPFKTREEKRAYDVIYRVANHKKLLIKQAAYREANREKLRADEAARYAANPAKIRATNDAWSRANPAKVRMSHMKRRASKKGALAERVDADAVFVRDGGVCQLCDRFIGTEKWHVDHRIPLIRGGEHNYRNCQLAHARCNLVKNSRMPV